MADVEPGALYRHYKGNVYEVLCTGRHSETGEYLVVYRSSADGQVWIRPLQMFFEKVVFDGQEVMRFSKV